VNTSKLREEWAKEPSGVMRTSMLQICDAYDKAMNTIVLNHKQAKQALDGKPITGKLVRYGDTNQLQGSRNE
jgi:hypothetical protein